MENEMEDRKTKFFRNFTSVVKKRIPILGWLPNYNSEKLICDMIAGITVGLTVMPQGLAYATLAGLEPQYGLYSAFMGCFVYAIFGNCKDITIGPTALMALMTYQQIFNRNVDFALLLCFLSGCVTILLSVLHLGVLIDFISIPVTVGFTSATSVIIATSQIKGLLGLKFTSSGFIDTVKNIGCNIKETKLSDSLLGFSCIIILLLLRRMLPLPIPKFCEKKCFIELAQTFYFPMKEVGRIIMGWEFKCRRLRLEAKSLQLKAKDLKVGSKNEAPTKKQHIINRIIWLVSTSRNALIVVLCSLLSYFLYDRESKMAPFILTGPVKSGLPEFRLPNFSTVVGNQTYSFTEMCNAMGSAIVMVPMIAILGNVAIAKAFASGNAIDATQEMLTLGLCNLLGSFASSMPITGSFSRSAVNHASGVKTPFGGVYTGALILLALSTLTPYFFFIPKASLAAVIICAVIFMIEYEVVKPMWKSNRKDLIPTFATFIICLVVGVEYGILIGVAINIILLLYPSARPNVRVEKCRTSQGTDYLLVIPGNNLYFPAVDFIRSSVCRAAAKEGSNSIPVVIDCRYILGADFTAAKGMASLIDEFNKRKQPIYFYQPCASVISVFKGANIEEFVHVCTEEELDHLLGAKHSKKKDDFGLNIEDVKEASRLLAAP